MNRYRFNKQTLQIARFADMQSTMRQDGRFSREVQMVLDTMRPFEEGNQVATVHFDRPILPMAVPTGYAKVIWGIHRGHKKREPGLSPFVERPVPHELMGFITVELKMAPGRNNPILTRAYGGNYTPPLPWMVSVDDAPGGKDECLDYWHSHAYLSRNRNVIRPGSDCFRAPHWYKSQSAANR